ncbi:methyltransferase domain-containing protein [Rhodococcus coprophilus]|nr:methyltransferase domain-containing protein [Rhodococcus coprophilus]
MTACRSCGHPHLDPALDLGPVPGSERFPFRGTSVRPDEMRNRLSMMLCRECGLAQLGGDAGAHVHLDRTRMTYQDIGQTIGIARGAGLLDGGTLSEFAVRTGDRWLHRLQHCGFRAAGRGERASVVVDSFVLEQEPDQHRALRARAAALAPDGVLLLEVHALSEIVAQRRWDAVRYGRFAYYSITTLRRALEDVGLLLWNAWPVGSTSDAVLVAALRDSALFPEPFVRRRLASERAEGITDVRTVRILQTVADRQAAALDTWLQLMAHRNRTVIAYGATPSSVTLFARARVSSSLIAAVADPSPDRFGRRMPGTDVPIVSPEAMVATAPDHILVMAPHDPAELHRRYPGLHGRWVMPPRSTDDFYRGD